MTGASFDGALEAAFPQVGGTLGMASEAPEQGQVQGSESERAKITGQVVMTGANFEGALNASSLEVGGDLSMQSDAGNKASFKDVNLNGAKITGQIDMTGASFDGALNADALQVDGNLVMQSNAQNKASFKNVILNGAKVAGNVSMIGATFDGALTAGLLQVDGNLFMGSLPEHKASFNEVILRSAKVAGNIYMPGASPRCDEGGHSWAPFRRHVTLLAGRRRSTHARPHCADKIDMFSAHVGRDLDLRGASLGDLDLSGASITAALQLGDVHGSAAWKGKSKAGALNLRNAHAGNLVDAKEGAWPAQGPTPSRRVHFRSPWRNRGRQWTENAQAGNSVVGQLGEARSRL